jgi:hypothetical protein
VIPAAFSIIPANIRLFKREVVRTQILINADFWSPSQKITFNLLRTASSDGTAVATRDRVITAFDPIEMITYETIKALARLNHARNYICLAKHAARHTGLDVGSPCNLSEQLLLLDSEDRRRD